MEGLRPEQLARLGVSYLEEAILNLLSEAERDTGQGLGPAKISKRLGTYLSWYSPRDGIVASFLEKLKGQGLVNNVRPGVGDWRLTEKGRENRRDD